jgi:NAD(P)-dependent dehydrogenase (short-subunit alcohol dehydrogenase family)
MLGGMRAIEGAAVLVTGATDGLGRGVAAELARRGARVLVHGRDRARAEAAAAEIGAEGVHLADFASLAQVRALAGALPPVEVLVNNAGLISRERRVTEDGCELTFQVNHLAHFLLTLRLLERSPPQRIVNVASAGQTPPDFADLMLERGYEPWRAYRQSKLAQVMFALELAERRPDVESTALHPATFMDTKMVRETVGRPHSSVREGVDATVRLVAEPGLEVSGRYFEGTREAAANPFAYDAEARRRLWEASERLSGLA